MKKVRITVKGTQTVPENPEERIELLTDGHYSHAAGESVLTYTESELTGMEGVKTTFRVNNQGIITLTREGEVNSVMVFEPGKKQTILYDTPFGVTTLGVDTIKASSLLGNRGGELELEYALDAGNLRVGVNKFKIKVRPM
ncbi:MAG: DUF1934 domain-containing protein [Oscillospiraceae bacterium]|jgi:uncharacterized beta-barrel protein YwiB (DUF1934 family)|nr:DUF1934 domain-containing protein [Oscillospiraceae bacterium]